jgi:hypothetical protein
MSLDLRHHFRFIVPKRRNLVLSEIQRKSCKNTNNSRMVRDRRNVSKMLTLTIMIELSIGDIIHDLQQFPYI